MTPFILKSAGKPTGKRHGLRQGERPQPTMAGGAPALAHMQGSLSFGRTGGARPDAHIPPLGGRRRSGSMTRLRMRIPGHPGLRARLTIPGHPGRRARLTIPGHPGRRARLTIPGHPGRRASPTPALFLQLIFLRLIFHRLIFLQARHKGKDVGIQASPEPVLPGLDVLSPLLGSSTCANQ
jgi:predicted RNA binding protein YcfA (HicA-like mRNA interferase family)